MADPHGFLRVHREQPSERSIDTRLGDYHEFVEEPSDESVRKQASRCMDCGIPFCHQGCPLGNLIPEWNDLVYRGRLDEAVERLHTTNNFPEVTGRICPAPCEASCVLNIDNAPVSIKTVERHLASYAMEQGLRPVIATQQRGQRVAIVGSGPAGLAAAQQLCRQGYQVTVFEKDDRVGGLLRYGIPDFKLEKHIVDARIEQMRTEGVVFNTGVLIGRDISIEDFRHNFDAVILCGGARKPRELDIPGRQSSGIYPAMLYLEQQNRFNAGDRIDADQRIDAHGKNVIVIGGGDTGSDCVGTANRQGAKHVLQLEIMPRPPDHRSDQNPWPEWPMILRTSSSHREGCERQWSLMSKRFEHIDGQLTGLSVVDVAFANGVLIEREESTRILPADLVFLAMGFVGPDADDLLGQWGVSCAPNGNIITTREGSTNVSGVFAAGDMSRGQSLVVWAIADGRRVAAGVDVFLQKTSLAECSV